MAWLTANALLREGKSWSGNERNCAYLNLGSGRPMANISAAAGLDFNEDSRAIGITDWDQDGDLDFWMTARTAPLVRYVQNNQGNSQASVAFLLTGSHCNRDAVGARLELHTPESSTLIKTVRAGDGFLSQSSKWIHFGLGDQTSNDAISVTIRWPSGTVETFSGIQPGKRYRITEGEKSVVAVVASTRHQVTDPDPSSSSDRAPTEQETGVGMFSRLPLPQLSVESFEGKTITIGGSSETATLINLWASWCMPCITELQDFNAHSSSLAVEQIRIVPICVDLLDSATDPEPALKVAKKFLNLKLAWAKTETIDKLETAQRTLLSGERPLPLPSSLLIDRSGCITKIYRGPVTATQVRRDVESGRGTQDATSRVLAVTPFGGQRRQLPAPTDPIQIAFKFFEGGYRDDAKSYLNQLIERAQFEKTEATNLSDVYYFLGTLLEEDGDQDKAINAFKNSARAAPDRIDTHKSIIRLAMLKGDASNVGHHADALTAINPQEGVKVQMKLAQALFRAGRQAQAITPLQTILKHRPGDVTAISNLAWILATHPDPTIRDGPVAVRLATMLVQSTSEKDPRALTTLALAQAEAGDFDSASVTARKAIAIAKKSTNVDLVSTLEAHIIRFQNQQTWHQGD